MENKLSERVEKTLKKIREARKTKGFSHESMAFELDMSPSAYNKLEHSITTLSLERFLKISEILNMPITEAFDIKTGDVLNQELKDNAIGKVETLYQENKEKSEKIEQLYESRLKDKEVLIEQLQKIIEKLST